MDISELTNKKNHIIRINLNVLTPKLISDIKKNKEKIKFISFNINQKNLNLKDGEKISNFLYKLERNKIKFKVVKPLPRCLFGFEYDKIVKEFDIPTSCKDCVDMFTIQEYGMTRFCKALNNRLGPKFEFMKNQNQIYEYFYTFYEKLEPSFTCRKCIYCLRGRCTGLCFRVEK